VNFGLVFSLLAGTDAAVRVARTYRDEFEEKVREGIAGIPGERARLLWLQNRIQFKTPLEDLLADEHGVAVAADEFNAITWDAIDPEDPYPGLARRMMSIPLCGPVERRVRHLQRMALDYRVDGAINPCHWGCRQGTGARGLIEQGLVEIGVPVLNLEVDCIDERNFTPGQLRTRLEAFVEMIAERRDDQTSAGVDGAEG
jgi:benzoyl-CoA reductase/2-hydroxyglutaryl-CoA dehydratase subunit BcrC/BadD/HgdB